MSTSIRSKKKSTAAERRRDPRFRSTMVSGVMVMGQDRWRPCQTRDLSRKGARIETKAKLPVGSLVKLFFMTTGNVKEERYEGTGLVWWHADGCYGIEFLFLKSTLKNAKTRRAPGRGANSSVQH